MSDQFRDAIGWAAMGDPIGDDDGQDAAEAMGNAVMAMPEMEAIRQGLRGMAMDLNDRYGCASSEQLRYWCARYNLPESVIDWVLS